MTTSTDHLLPAINRIDALFRESDLGNYYLSLQVGEKSFAFCILDSVSNKYIGLGEMRLPVTKTAGETEIKLPFDAFLAKVMAALPVLKHKFKSTKVIWEGPKYTLVPPGLFEETARDDLLSFNVPPDPREMTFHDLVPGLQIVNVYSIPRKEREIIHRLFRVDQLTHLSSVLIESIYQNYRAELARPRVFIHVRETHFDLLIMDHATLYFCNTFVYHRPEDLLYFTIFTLEQLGFSQEQVEVVLMGKVARNTPLYNLIFKYLRRVEFARRSPGYEYSFVFNEIPAQSYFPLLNLNQCGL